MAVNLFERGANLLARRLLSHGSDEVEYRRGDLGVTIRAVSGALVQDEIDREGIVHRRDVRSFLFSAEDLAFGGQRFLPQVGDLITHEDETGSREYQVVSAQGDQPFEFVDAWRRLVRVRTQRIRNV